MTDTRKEEKILLNLDEVIDFYMHNQYGITISWSEAALITGYDGDLILLIDNDISGDEVDIDYMLMNQETVE